MGIAIEGIANYEDADYVRYLVPADGYLKYYIGTVGSWRGGPMNSSEIDDIRQNMKYVDGITGLAWKEVYSESEAQIRFFKVTSSYYDDPDTLGQTESDNSGMTVTWLDHSTKGITIKHEIGHVASLDHPYGDGYNASYTRADTIMSYNRSVTGTAQWTDSDKLAMKSIWGEDQQAFVPGRGTHNGTVFADKFYLQTFDGYGEGSADVINGFNASNGDVFELTTSGAGWDPAKTTRTFYTISDRTETYRSGWRRVWKRGKKKRKPVYTSRTANDLDTVAKTDSSNISIYNTSTGQLYVDRNGSAHGLGDGGLIAFFNGAPSLTTDDIRWYSG